MQQALARCPSPTQSAPTPSHPPGRRFDEKTREGDSKLTATGALCCKVGAGTRAQRELLAAAGAGNLVEVASLAAVGGHCHAICCAPLPRSQDSLNNQEHEESASEC